MKGISINNVKYKVPTKWEDIHIRHQIKLSELEKENPKASHQLLIMSAYGDIPLDVLKHIHISRLPKILAHLKFITDQPETKHMSEFEHNGHTYSVMDSLLKGEFQDFISLETLVKEFADGDYNSLTRMIAVLAKRDGETLDDYDIDVRAREFLDLPLLTAISLQGFFLNCANMSQISTVLSSDPEVEKNLDKAATKFLNDIERTLKQQDGLGWLGRWRRNLSVKFVRSLKKTWGLS